jgi:hypothetical protein
MLGVYFLVPGKKTFDQKIIEQESLQQKFKQKFNQKMLSIDVPLG